MLIQTQNDWNIGKIWNPFDANYTEEYQEKLRNKNVTKKNSKQTLSRLFTFMGLK